jgi:predicted transcriptional regulator
MTSTSLKKQLDEYLPLLSSKQQALVLELVKSFLNIDTDDKRIIRKKYNKEIDEAVDRVEDGSFVTQEETKKELSKLEPMSMSSFKKMIDQAKQDHDAGRVVSHEDLKKKVKTWK